MAIEVDCPSCGRGIRAKDAQRGRSLTCPNCATAVVVDGPRVPDHDVFISHSSKDKNVADATVAALEEKRIRCWVAPRDIPPGVTWGSAIVEAIGESRIMVLLFSQGSNSSQQVLREVERAVAKSVRILPMRLEDVAMSKDMEYFISATHWLDATTGKLDENLQMLCRQVQTLLPGPAPGRPPTQTAQAAPPVGRATGPPPLPVAGVVGRYAEATRPTGSGAAVAAPSTGGAIPRSPPEVPLRYADGYVAARDAAFAVIAVFLGLALQGFDQSVVSMTLPQVSLEFGSGIGAVASSFGVSMVCRVIGAVIFGLLADRYGRRWFLFISLGVCLVVELATPLAGSLPAFLALRAVFALAIGCQWGVGVSLALEKCSPKWRGAIAGLIQSGFAIGILSANAIGELAAPTVLSWRPVFCIGALPALIGMLVLLAASESNVWRRSKAESLGSLGRCAVAKWRHWLYITVLVTLLAFGLDWISIPQFELLVKTRNLGPATLNFISNVSVCGGIMGSVLIGLASDKFGRRWSMAAGLLGAVMALALWVFSPTIAAVIVGSVLMKSLLEGAFGVLLAHAAELLPDSVRGSLLGIGYQLAFLVAGTSVLIEFPMAERLGYSSVIMIGSGLTLTIAAGVALMGPERRGIRFGQD